MAIAITPTWRTLRLYPWSQGQWAPRCNGDKVWL
jgi:hypothetical protein